MVAQLFLTLWTFMKKHNILWSKAKVKCRHTYKAHSLMKGYCVYLTQGANSMATHNLMYSQDKKNAKEMTLKTGSQEVI